MSKIITYLTFNGNCREAMTFYQECLGGELHFQTLNESPDAEHLPQHIKEYILHSSLKNDHLTLMATDMVGEGGLTKGNSISIWIACSSKEEIQSYYNKLSYQGNATHPIKQTFWGALFGGLIDKYGNHWLFHFKE